MLSFDEPRSATERVDTDARNINDLLRGAARGLRDGLAATYWGHLTTSGIDPDRAKLETAALAAEHSVVAAVEAAAAGLVQLWLREYSRAISDLPEAKKSAYHAIRAQVRESELGELTLPSAITAAGDDPGWLRHVYVDAAGSYPARFTSWEEGVLRTELQEGRGLLAWYRNAVGGDRALRIPYHDGEYSRPLYPDFVFFHETEDGVMPSIVDPHNYALADTASKWRGLAEYAQRHGVHFSRIDAVIKTDSGDLLRLDLKDATIRAALKAVVDTDGILRLFRDHGGAYS